MELIDIAIEHLSRKFYRSWPKGKKDSGGRWYPDEMLECCKGIRSPSRAWPNTYLNHCKSLAHMAHEYGVELKDLKDMLKKKNLPLFIGKHPWLDEYVFGKLKGKDVPQ